MSLTQLLLKGTAEEIAGSPLARGIGPKGADSIVKARGSTSDVLSLIQAGARKTDDQNILLERLVSEETAGRQNIAQLLSNRANQVYPNFTPGGYARGEAMEYQAIRHGVDRIETNPSRLLGYTDLNAQAQEANIVMQAVRKGATGEPNLITDPRRMLESFPGPTRVTDSMPRAEAYLHSMDRMRDVQAYISASTQHGPRISNPARLLGYDEAAHMNGNITVASEAMSGGTSGNRGLTSYSGYYQPGETPSSSGLLGSMSQDGAAGVMSSIAFGAAIGGVANYAMGGEFGEGAMMGGLAGGAIKIGARAIQQNQSSIEGFLQRTALGDAGQNMTRDQAAAAIQGMPSAGEGASLMQRGAFNILKSENPSLGMQSRYMVMGGSALSGVMFTGSRKDKRRGFNAHRGNRI